MKAELHFFTVPIAISSYVFDWILSQLPFVVLYLFFSGDGDWWVYNVYISVLEKYAIIMEKENNYSVGCEWAP